MLDKLVAVFPWLYAGWVILILLRDSHAGTVDSGAHDPEHGDGDAYDRAFDTGLDDDFMSSHSDDVCTDPAYSFLSCNIYHHDDDSLGQISTGNLIEDDFHHFEFDDHFHDFPHFD